MRRASLNNKYASPINFEAYKLLLVCSAHGSARCQCPECATVESSYTKQLPKNHSSRLMRPIRQVVRTLCHKVSGAELFFLQIFVTETVIRLNRPILDLRLVIPVLLAILSPDELQTLRYRLQPEFIRGHRYFQSESLLPTWQYQAVRTVLVRTVWSKRL